MKALSFLKIFLFHKHDKKTQRCIGGYVEIHKLTIKSACMKNGNVNQVAAFGKLVGICNDLGARYNPSKAALTPTALATLLEQAQQSLEAVNVARVNYVLAINSRQDLYAGVYKLAARIVRALQASESSIENIREARMIRRKLAPQPTVKKGKVVKTGAENPAPSPGHISYLDYAGQAEAFANLVQLVERIPSYAPNETDLQLATLQEMVAKLRNASLAVARTANALANARIQRNSYLLGKGGLFETGNAVKDYIRSVFGVTSEPVKELSKLRLAA